jgi:hypothetical protein
MPRRDKVAYASYMRDYRARKKSEGNPVPSGTNNVNRNRSAFRDLKFIGWDGEGVGHPLNRYIMLSNSERECIETNTPDGCLSQNPARLFDFILSYSKRYIVHVIYGGGYDFNMWILGLPDVNKTELMKTGQTSWDKYRLEYVPRKCFTIRRKDGKKRLKATVWDTNGFFQSSFLKAIKDWKIGTPEEHELIESMKKNRQTFTQEQSDEIKAYNYLECELLAKLISHLRDLLADDPNNPGNEKPWLPLKRWDGAGAVASAIYRKEGVKNYVGSSVPFRELWNKFVKNQDYHYKNKSQQSEIEYALRCAYFGGRIECFKKGRANQRGWDLDIVSAYPAQMLKLPSFAEGGYWEQVTGDKFSPELFGVWNVIWDCHKDNSAPYAQHKGHTIYPLPYRVKSGTVLFPDCGEGWYHTVEVAAARDDFRNDIKVVSGWVWHPVNDEKPFAFVQTYFNQRQELKRIKHAAQMIIKLGLNSLYGKMAQTIGSEFEEFEPTFTLACLAHHPEWFKSTGCNRIFSSTPRYFNYAWAGAVTAGCRAALYREAIKRESDIVMIQTDGLFGLGDAPEFVEDGTLGSLEAKYFDDAIVVQAGVYWLGKLHDGVMNWDGDNNKGGVVRTRGFGKDEVGWERVLEGWQKCKGNPYSEHRLIKYTSKPRFRTLSSCAAITKNTFGKLGHWETQERVLNLFEDSKRSVEKRGVKLHERMYDAPCLTNPDYELGLPSRPCDPKWLLDEDEYSKWLRQTEPMIEGSDFNVNGDANRIQELMNALQERKTA